MFFVLSKILIPLESPGDLLLLLLLAGLVCTWFARWRRRGLFMVSLAALGFLLIVTLPVSSWVTAPLENRFPRPVVWPAHVDGIVVLGGAVDPVTTARRGIPTLNSDAERMTEFVRLAKRYPDAKLIFSGGSGLLTLERPHFTEADSARLFFAQQGLDLARILFESRSRNTYENVEFSKRLAKPEAGQTWILVSSAQDMPRSVGIFLKLGWPDLPDPVAYKSDQPHSY